MNRSCFGVFLCLFTSLAIADGQALSSDSLLVADTSNSTIYVGSLSDFDLSPLPLGTVTAPVAVDYDPVDEMVYWTDFTDRTISRASLDGSMRQTVIHGNLVQPDGLSLDPKVRLMFWTDGRPGNKIERAFMDGSHRQVIVSAHLKRPRAIVADQQGRHIYWSTWGGRATIERADYNGNNRQILVGNSIKWPNGITLDLKGGWLYWCDAKYKTFERCDLQGNNRSTILREIYSHPYDLAIYGESMLWTDWNAHTILRWQMTQREMTGEGPAVFQRAAGIHVHLLQEAVTTSNDDMTSSVDATAVNPVTSEAVTTSKGDTNLNTDDTISSVDATPVNPVTSELSSLEPSSEMSYRSTCNMPSTNVNLILIQLLLLHFK